MKAKKVIRLIYAAQGLISIEEREANIEYDRAIVELTTELLGLPMSEKYKVEKLIRDTKLARPDQG